jgi:hypothetical protein
MNAVNVVVMDQAVLLIWQPCHLEKVMMLLEHWKYYMKVMQLLLDFNFLYRVLA